MSDFKIIKNTIFKLLNIQKYCIFFLMLLISSAVVLGGCELINSAEEEEPSSLTKWYEKDKDNNDNGTKKKNKDRKKRKKTEYVDYTGGTNITWFDEQGLSYTKMGEFKAKFSGTNSPDTIKEMPADCWISEDYDGVEDGYKNIVAVLNIYTKDAGGVEWWTSYFDGYTGQSYEFKTESTTVYNGCNIVNKGKAKLVILDEEYDVDILYEIEETDDVITETITFTVPASYDGLVIQIGQSSKMYEEKRDTYKLGQKIYYADDFTDMHEKYDYFSLLANKK